MPATCQLCGHTTLSYVTKFRAGKTQIACKICEHPPVTDQRVANPYTDMVLEHVLGDDGKPVRVTSKRQLLQAEKRYGFRSLVAHTDEANFDKPPQRKTPNIAEIMTKERKWLYPEIAEPMYREMKARGEVA